MSKERNERLIQALAKAAEQHRRAGLSGQNGIGETRRKLMKQLSTKE